MAACCESYAVQPLRAISATDRRCASTQLYTVTAELLKSEERQQPLRLCSLKLTVHLEMI